MSIVCGDYEITMVRAGVHWWDGGAFFGVVPKTLWSREIECDEANRIPAGFNCYLVRSGSTVALIETGGGDKSDARARERMRIPEGAPGLRETMESQGIDPESVTLVINSHLHWDHCGGNTIVTAGGVRPAFPRARYVAQRGEWEHAHTRHPRDSVSYIDANYGPLVESGQMTLVDGEVEVAPGIWMHPAPGHNRDICIVTAGNADEKFCFFSDVVPTAVHARPTWVAAFDLDPIRAIDTKSEWLARAADGGWVCGFSHDAAMDFAEIERAPKVAYRAVPVAR